eukprot:gene14523-15806_t
MPGIRATTMESPTIAIFAALVVLAVSKPPVPCATLKTNTTCWTDRYGSHKVDCTDAKPDWMMLLGCPTTRRDCNVTAPYSKLNPAAWRCYDPKTLDVNHTRYVGNKASDYCQPRVSTCAPPPPPPAPPPSLPPSPPPPV